MSMSKRHSNKILSLDELFNTIMLSLGGANNTTLTESKLGVKERLGHNSLFEKYP